MQLCNINITETFTIKILISLKHTTTLYYDCVWQDGSSYVHCERCGRCVKPSRVHCDTCNICDLQDHKCGQTRGTGQFSPM